MDDDSLREDPRVIRNFSVEVGTAEVLGEAEPMQLVVLDLDTSTMDTAHLDNPPVARAAFAMQPDQARDIVETLLRALEHVEEG